MLIYHGSYTGNGTSQTITGLPFQPDLVIIKALTSSQQMIFRNAAMTAGRSVQIRADTAYLTDGITAFTSDGFSISNNNSVNISSTTYAYVAIKDTGDDDFAFGVFTGDGNDGKKITGLGFRPDYVLIKANSNIVGATKFSTQLDTAMQFGGADRTDLTVSLDADGFTVNNGSTSGANLVNVSAVEHAYFAFKNYPNRVHVFQYTGATGDDRNITTPGFQPGFAHIKSQGAEEPRLRFNVQTGDNSQNFDQTQGGNAIQSFLSTGFQVGTDSSVNNNTVKYNALVLASSIPLQPTIAGIHSIEGVSTIQL